MTKTAGRIGEPLLDTLDQDLDHVADSAAIDEVCLLVLKQVLTELGF